MKNPALVSIFLLVLSTGCSDESAFNAVAASIPSASIPAPVGEPTTQGDAVAEVPVTPPEETESVPPVVGSEAPVILPSLESTTLPSSEVTSLPNAQTVTKVGVNFEDQPDYGDADFNDAVLCFKGGFEVTPSIIQSNKKQTVEAVLFSDAQCTNHIRVNIVRGSQVISSVTYNLRTDRAASLEFEKGDRLDVSLLSIDCEPGAIRSMTDVRYTKLSPDICNVQ